MFKRGWAEAASTRSTDISCGTFSPFGIGAPLSNNSESLSHIMASTNEISSWFSQKPIIIKLVRPLRSLQNASTISPVRTKRSTNKICSGSGDKPAKAPSSNDQHEPAPICQYLLAWESLSLSSTLSGGASSAKLSTSRMSFVDSCFTSGVRWFLRSSDAKKGFLRMWNQGLG